MQYVKARRLIVTHFNFKLSMSFLSSLASLVEFLNEEKLFLTFVAGIVKTNENRRTRYFHICYDLLLFIQTSQMY